MRKVAFVAKGAVFLLIIVSLFLLFTSDFNQHHAVLLNFFIPRDMTEANFEMCLLVPHTEYNKTNENSISSRIESLLSRFKKNANLSSSSVEKMKAMSDRFKVLMEFNSFMPLLNVTAFLIEPSILFCMLSTQEKNLLLKRGFDLDKFQTTNRVVTFGIFEDNVAILEKPEVLGRMAGSNFRVEFVEQLAPEWMLSARKGIEKKSRFLTHLLFHKQDWMVFLVVFYKRANFLWHAAFNDGMKSTFPTEQQLFFAESNSAYERFEPLAVGFKNKYLGKINIPSDPQYFLYEISSSRVLECNMTVYGKFDTHTVRVLRLFMATSSTGFESTAITAIRELKSIFRPMLMKFWIWSGTLLGWHRECGIIPYTNDIDFGSWASDVDDVEDLVEAFFANKRLKLKERMGLIDRGLEFHLDIQRLRTDVFFVYTEENGTWHAGHKMSRRYYYKSHLPFFTICSAEFLGQKVLLPCETETIVSREYGPNWTKPILKWNYLTSVPNRGPSIYWEKNLTESIYTEY